MKWNVSSKAQTQQEEHLLRKKDQGHVTKQVQKRQHYVVGAEDEKAVIAFMVTIYLQRTCRCQESSHSCLNILVLSVYELHRQANG